MSKNNYDIGNFNTICDNCGAKRKRSECKMTWDGFLMCTVKNTSCWYPRHPNDFPLPIINDGLPVIDARPKPPQTANVYVSLPPIEITKWEDKGLTFNSLTWLWDDDISQSILFNDGNP